MVVVVGSNNESKVADCRMGRFISTSFQLRFVSTKMELHCITWFFLHVMDPPLDYLILFVCNGPSIGLPDSFYVQWCLH
jgi:hypothetical protein